MKRMKSYCYPWILGCILSANGACSSDERVASPTPVERPASPATDVDMMSAAPFVPQNNQPELAAGGSETPTAGSQANGATGSMTTGETGGAAGMVSGEAGDPMPMDPAVGTTGGQGDDGQGDDGQDAAGAPTQSADCDRDCLLGFMQMYLDALVAHDPSTLPVAENLKYTENGLPAEIGEATWESFEEPIANSRLDFADPVQQNVGTQLAYREGGRTLVRFGLRLKVEEQQITEIESMTARQGDHFAWSEGNLEPQPVFFETPANPTPRDELLAITNLYVDYLEGSKSGRELPFAEDCARYENGLPLAQGKASFESQSWNFTVEPRRIAIVDELMGITWGNLPFDGVGRSETLVVGEAFKIMDGEFKMIQAVLRYQTNDEWN